MNAEACVWLWLPGLALLGAAWGTLLACIPGLHIYTALGALLAGLYPYVPTAVPADLAIPFVAGLLASWALANTIPAVLLAAPDESALYTVLPGQRYLIHGRGFEAVMLSAFGAAGGTLLLLLAAPFAPRALPTVFRVLRPHFHWMVWAVLAFMVLSEWPRGWTVGTSGWRRWLAGWQTPLSGLLTLLLSGMLGFILIYRSPLPARMAFQNLMPALAGLFAIPGLLLTLICRMEIPRQTRTAALDVDVVQVLHGIAAGTLGGAFAAAVPVVTGGIGGMLAGHAASLRDERAFLVSQGASKSVYYLGGLVLCCLPGVHVTRGAAAGMLTSLYGFGTTARYWLCVGAAALGTAFCLAILAPLTGIMVRLINRCSYRRIATLGLLLVVAAVVSLTGPVGVFVMLVAGGIGLVPMLFGSRRLNCLGVILLPLACAMSGIGARVAGWLGL